MAVNKVEYAGKVLLDLTEDTVTADKLMKGVMIVVDSELSEQWKRLAVVAYR